MPEGGAGERNLQRLLAGLAPRLLDGTWVFCTVAGDAPVPDQALAVFREEEGVSLVLAAEEARRLGLPAQAAMRCITLSVHSSLEAVGLTAAVSGALAAAGISANVVAAYHHDHVFVPVARAQEALALLQGLAADTR